jgi:hypothetical protein
MIFTGNDIAPEFIIGFNMNVGKISPTLANARPVLHCGQDFIYKPVHPHPFG